MNAGSKRFGLRSTRVCTPDGEMAASVVIKGEQFEAVYPRDSDNTPTGVLDCPCEDLGDWVIMPGIIDAHVHVNEPGRTEWEGFESATKAAIAGGVTTVVDMPLNSDPVTTSVETLSVKRSAAEKNCWCDVGFYGGLVPGNLNQIERLIQAGVFGIKSFLCDSGLDEFPASTESDLRAALPILKTHHVPLLVHAESADNLDSPIANPRSYAEYLSSRPAQWESSAIELLIRLCEEFDAPIHVVHLSTATALPMIAAAKLRGLPLSVETCPHYLTFSAEQIRDGDTRFKCAPPIRGEANRRLLTRAVAGGGADLVHGEIDTIGSDHSPCPPELKRLDSGDFRTAWGGIASLQLTLPALWTATRDQNISLSRVAELLATGPARLLGLQKRKGRLHPGLDADLCIWDPECEWTVRPEELLHRHPITPYEGQSMFGMLKRTYLRGQLAKADQPPRGVTVQRTRLPQMARHTDSA